MASAADVWKQTQALRLSGYCQPDQLLRLGIKRRVGIQLDVFVFAPQRREPGFRKQTEEFGHDAESAMVKGVAELKAIKAGLAETRATLINKVPRAKREYLQAVANHRAARGRFI